MDNIPLIFLLFVLTAPSSADSSRIQLHQVAPQLPLDVGLTSTESSNGPVLGPNSQSVLGPSSYPTTPTLSFFMHDIMGGTHPSARMVTGNTPKTEAEAAAANLPFSKPKNNVFPVAGGVPLITTTGRNSNGGNKKRALAMFGSLTTVDDEVTEGEELGSAVVGRAQGFYFVSSMDGSSHTVALTVIVQPHTYMDQVLENHDDTISFFGVHRRVWPESPIAVVGGTGKYEKASGFAVIENRRRGENQHLTDGVDTIVHFIVYLSSN